TAGLVITAVRSSSVPKGAVVKFTPTIVRDLTAEDAGVRELDIRVLTTGCAECSSDGVQALLHALLGGRPIADYSLERHRGRASPRALQVDELRLETRRFCF